MTREELDRLAELRSAISGGGPVSDAVVAEWDHAIFAAAPALLAAARDVDRIVKDYVAQARVASDALREANELREWQREAAFILRFAANGHARAISRADALALLARVKP